MVLSLACLWPVLGLSPNGGVACPTTIQSAIVMVPGNQHSLLQVEKPGWHLMLAWRTRQNGI